MTNMALRIGELLIARGLLTEEQVEEILAAQRERGRPFGCLAEQMFGLSAMDIEEVWAEQFGQIAGRIDPRRERIDPAVHAVVSTRQAWQFAILPMRRQRGELVIATTIYHLPRAMRFIAWHVGEEVQFVVSGMSELEAALNAHYPLPGMHLAVPRRRKRCA
jgi:hypothetical protein